MKQKKHPWTGKRIFIAETFDEGGWSGILLKMVEESDGVFKYLIKPDRGEEEFLVLTNSVHIWLAKDQPQRKRKKKLLRLVKS